MKKYLPFIACLLILNINVTAQQAPFMQWQKTYGGSAEEEAANIVQTTDGGYIMAGSADSEDGDVSGGHGFNDYWIVKTDASGKIQWKRAYGGSGQDAAHSIQQTSDGGYIVAGDSYSTDGDITSNKGGNDVWVIKLDSDGNISWQKNYGGSKGDYATSIQQTSDGGYIVAGDSYSTDGDLNSNKGSADLWVIKLDTDGNISWQKAYGGKKDELATSIHQTTDGGYFVSGTTSSNNGDVSGFQGSEDYWVLKLDAIGTIEWQKCLGGKSIDESYSSKQTTDGGYIIAGYTYSNNGDVSGNHGDRDYWIVKLNATGTTEWKKCYGGTGGDDAADIIQTNDGGYAISGYSSIANKDVTSSHGDVDYWLLKINAVGAVQWDKSFGGDYVDVAANTIQTPDGGYIMFGSAYSHNYNVTNNHGKNTGDYWAVKLSPDVLNNTIVPNVTNDPPHCDSDNYVAYKLINTSSAYTVRLYYFGELYDSAVNVTGQISFHNLPPGAYYASATDDNGKVSFTSKTDIVAVPKNLHATSVGSVNASLAWSDIICARYYRVQFHKQGDTIWSEKNSDEEPVFYLKDLKPATTYVWRVASRKLKNGIYSTGKYSDSIMFTTASAFAVDAAVQNSITSNNKIVFTVTPNPANRFFIIRYNAGNNTKANAVLYDVNGKEVWTSGLINANALNNKTVNVNQFAKGIFYLKITNENGELIGTTKVIVTK